jgi:hypothetical protein
MASYELQAVEGQEAITRDGQQALISTKGNVVMLKAAPTGGEFGDRPSFVVAAFNAQAAPIDFDPAVITVTVVGSDGQSANLRVYTYAELVAEEKRRQNVKLFAAAVGGVARGMQAADAGYSNTTGSFNAYGSYGQNVRGSYSSTTYNNYSAFAAQQQANAMTSMQIAAIQQDGERNLQALGQYVAKKNTTMPGEWYGGLVVLGRPENANGSVSYTIVVPFSGEQHSFNIKQVGGVSSSKQDSRSKSDRKKP